VKKIFLVLIFILCVLFSISLYLENPHAIEFNYYFDINWQVNFVVFLFSVFFTGALFGALLMSMSVFKQKIRTSAEHRKLLKVEKEVENLRALPLKDEV